MGKRKLNLAPKKRQIPITTPDRIPDKVATLDDYENMAQKIALHSDDIIDAALDKMEAREAEPTHAAPCEEAERPSPETDFQPETRHDTTEDAAPGKNGLQDEIARLKAELAEIKAKKLRSYNGGLAEEINKLRCRNDDLILRNSELEFEISRLGAENSGLKQQLEKLRNQVRLPPQGSSTEGYTRVPRGIPQRVGVKRPKTTMNGYESWN